MRRASSASLLVACALGLVLATASPVAAVKTTGDADLGGPSLAEIQRRFAQLATETPTLTPTATPSPTVTLTPLPTATPLAATAAEEPVPFPDQCWGDEQVFFVPPKPFAGTDAVVAWSSRKRHDVRNVRLTGPIKPGPVAERRGLLGWSYEWTMTVPGEGWYEWTFWVDIGRKCATSGFNAFPVFGATPSPTLTPVPGAPTNTPGPTATPTATTVPRPLVSAITPPNGGCNQYVVVSGGNFGPDQASVGGQVFFNGPDGVKIPTIFSWSNSEITLSTPADMQRGAVYEVVVATRGGASSPPGRYTVGAAQTPTPAPTPVPPAATPTPARC